MASSDGHQKGPQRHAEGQHGEKTFHHFIEDLHGKHGGSPESEGRPQEKQPEAGEPVRGRHRLDEDRQQHDEAEKNSEHGQLSRELDRDHRPLQSETQKGREHS